MPCKFAVPYAEKVTVSAPVSEPTICAKLPPKEWPVKQMSQFGYAVFISLYTLRAFSVWTG